MKELELKTDRHNRPIQKSKLDINRLYRPIKSEDRIGIRRSINRTFRPPLPLGERRDKHVTVCARTSDILRRKRPLYLKSYLDSLYTAYSEPQQFL
jgi:hypothetical protein